MSDEQLVVEFVLARVDHPDLDLEELAALVVRQAGRDRMLELAARNLATRDELRGDVVACAVEQVLRIVLTARGPAD